MRVRMIFADEGPDGETLRVGEVYDLPQEVAQPLVDAGRAEPPTPAAAEPRGASPEPEDAPAPAKKAKRGAK